MISRLNHVAIVVPDLAVGSAVYRDTLGAEVSEPVDMPEHGVTTVFVELANTKIELLHPLGDDSPIAKFLSRNPKLGDANPKIGAHNKPVLFLHPKDFCGTLIELEQV